MAPPRPERIVELLDELARILEPKGQKPKMVGLRVEIEEGFRWLQAAYAQSQRTGERVRGGGGPNSGGPTAAVGLSGKGERMLNGRRITTLHASAQDKVRRDLELAGRLTSEGVGSFRGAARALARAFEVIDQDTGHTPSEFFDPSPKPEVPDELDRVRTAQHRRTERGEVYAEDAFPKPIEHDQHKFLRHAVVRKDWRGEDETVIVCRKCGETRDHPGHEVEEVSA
jgi:hypothetical protein